MKTKFWKRNLAWMAEKGLRIGFVLSFLLIAASVYAATINFPSVDPAPVTGVVGQFVGVSNGAYSSLVNGYQDVHELCSNHVGSHVCIAAEMINTMNYNPDAFNDFSGQVFINNGTPAHDETLSNDCEGWKVHSNTVLSSDGKEYKRFGSTWHLDKGKGLIKGCATSLNFACCK